MKATYWLLILILCQGLHAQNGAKIVIDQPNPSLYHEVIKWLSSELTVDGRLEITFRKDTINYWMEGPGPRKNTSIWKEVYTVKDGKIVLDKVVKAKWTPEKTTTEPERIEWP